jgi:hypothetical protein
MARPPRDISVERLVSLPLLTYAYIIVGMAESIICFGAYLWVFTNAGVPAKVIFLIKPEDETWTSRADLSTVDEELRKRSIDGKDFTAEDQEMLVRQVCLEQVTQHAEACSAALQPCVWCWHPQHGGLCSSALAFSM